MVCRRRWRNSSYLVEEAYETVSSSTVAASRVRSLTCESVDARHCEYLQEFDAGVDDSPAMVWSVRCGSLRAGDCRRCSRWRRIAACELWHAADGVSACSYVLRYRVCRVRRAGALAEERRAILVLRGARDCRGRPSSDWHDPWFVHTGPARVTKHQVAFRPPRPRTAGCQPVALKRHHDCQVVARTPRESADQPESDFNALPGLPWRIPSTAAEPPGTPTGGVRQCTCLVLLT